MPESANQIISVTEESFGANSRPKAIILTHDHFDHVGEAFVTVKQESLYKVLTQEQEISGPPRYFTPD